MSAGNAFNLVSQHMEQLRQELDKARQVIASQNILLAQCNDTINQLGDALEQALAARFTATVPVREVLADVVTQLDTITRLAQAHGVFNNGVYHFDMPSMVAYTRAAGEYSF